MSGNEEIMFNKSEKKKDTTKQQNPLWTKDFTIITVGSIVSKLGNAISGFAIGLLVLDYTKSTFLYALYMVLYMAPRVIMPLLAGPYLDKYSRKRTIYTLDFISTGIYLTFAIIMFTGHFSYFFLVTGCVLLGSIDSVYNVAYDSFYPMLVSEGNYTKAYSISSTLETFTMMMIPVSAFLYNLVGIVPLFLFNAITFCTAAIFETQISTKESYTNDSEFSLKQYKDDFVEGVNYLKAERGLLAIAIYFTVTMFANGAMETLTLPYFKAGYEQGEYIYIAIMGFGVFGRMIGGIIHYKYKYPVDKKFSIALFVYFVITILDGSFLYLPFQIMMATRFLSGILGVTSYNIRISATQSYVPDERKGRFNGTFQMFVTCGMLLGELIAGALAEVVEIPYVITGFMIVNFFAIILVMYRNRDHVKQIYNRHA